MLDESFPDRDFAEDFEEEEDPTRAAGELFRGAVSQALREPHMGRSDGRRPPPTQGPLAAYESGQGHERWLVEHADERSGRLVIAGYCPSDTTSIEFATRFLRLMPAEGMPPKTFYLTPLDGAGRKLVKEPSAQPSFDAYSEDVVHARQLAEAAEAQGGLPGLGGGAYVGGRSAAVDPALTVLSAQVQQLMQELRNRDDRAEADRARIEEERNRLVDERIANASTMGADLSEGYRLLANDAREMNRTVQTAQVSGVGDLLKAQREMAAADQARILEDRKAEREREKTERELTIDRMRMENELTLAKIKAETEIRAAELRAQAEMSRAAIESERERIRDERERDRRDREDRDKREADQRREEAQRVREHQERMDKLAAEERADARRRTDEENARRDEHAKTIVALYARDQKGPDLNGMIEKGVALAGLFGIQKEDVGAFAKAILGGGTGSGPAAVIVEAIAGVMKEVVKRLPLPETEEDGDEEEEDGEEEEAEDPGQVQQVRPQRRAVEQRTPTRQIPEKVADDRGPEAFLRRSRAPAPPSAQEPEAATPQAQAPEVAAITPERKAGREAVLALVDALESADTTEMAPIVTRVVGERPELLAYLNQVGVQVAFADADARPFASPVQSILTNLGLYAPRSNS